MVKSTKPIVIITIDEINDTTVTMAMDVLEKQVLELSDKVDSLHGLIAQLSEKVDVGMTATPLTSSSILPDAGPVNISPAATRRSPNPDMMHKDILSDEPYPDTDKSSTAHKLSPEIQIQRLTAQLTAAYNRIAALEEQIMAYRAY
ncbi:MAG: hypothetical protein AAFV85_00540 [Cyanobacteria bacterium J06634_6]